MIIKSQLKSGYKRAHITIFFLLYS